MESDPVSPEQVKVGKGVERSNLYNGMVADMDQFELAKIPLRQAGVDEGLHLEETSEILFS